MSKKVTISKEEYKRLLKAENWVDALEAAGIEQWENIALAYDIFDDITQVLEKD